MHHRLSPNGELWQLLDRAGIGLHWDLVSGQSIYTTEISLKDQSFVIHNHLTEGCFVKTNPGRAHASSVSSLVPHSATFREVVNQRPNELSALSRELGISVGRLHQQGHPEVPKAQDARRPIQFLIRLINQTCEGYFNSSHADRELIGILQRHDEFVEQLTVLDDEWRSTGIVHNDLTWNNVLVQAGENGVDGIKLTIIDWETAGGGDPDWDVGTLFAEFLTYWVAFVPMILGQDSSGYLRQSSRHLNQIQAAIRAFWSAYINECALQESECTRRLDRAVRYAGARLMQTAYEHTSMLATLNYTIVQLLQLSLNIMERPEETRGYLIGIATLDQDSRH